MSTLDVETEVGLILEKIAGYPLSHHIPDHGELPHAVRRTVHHTGLTSRHDVKVILEVIHANEGQINVHSPDIDDPDY